MKNIPWQGWALLAVGILVLTVGLIFGPEYKRTTETNERLEQTVATSQAESVSMKSVIENLRETVKRSSVSGSVKEPVQMAGNVVAYREVKWRTTNTESVKESVKQALEEARQASSSHSESVTVTNTKKETVTKRGAGLTVSALGKFKNGKYSLSIGQVGYTPISFLGLKLGGCYGYDFTAGAHMIGPLLGR